MKNTGIKYEPALTKNQPQEPCPEQSQLHRRLCKPGEDAAGVLGAFFEGFEGGHSFW